MAGGAEELRRGHLRYLPVVPARVEFAAEVRRTILAERPEVVAVELPRWLGEAYERAVGRLPELSVITYPEEEESERGVYLVVEPGDAFVEAVRSAREVGAEVVLIEPDAVDRPHLEELYPDSYAMTAVGYERYVAEYRVHGRAPGEEAREHASAIAYHLQGTDPGRETLVVVSLNVLEAVLEAMERPQSEPRARAMERAEVSNLHPETLAEVTSEHPFLLERYERWRERMEDGRLVDRRWAQVELYKEAERNYEAQTGEKLAHWQRRMLARYTRNLAMVDGQLAASLFDLAVAARAVVDDNFAYEVWQAANGYSHQRDESELETVNLKAEEVYLRHRRMKLRRREKRAKQRLMPRGLKARPKEKRAGEWAEQVDGEAICSYPPEDIVIEDYGKSLRQRAKSLLSEERTRVEPFQSSMLDGIDMRETIRHWAEGKIFVRRSERRTGEVGAVVVIFDEDREERYTYLTTWLGENQNESDMAFYSTPPFEHMVGPGIGRAEYGGFLMTLPPRRMFDVWGDRDYDFAETKAERLLMAGLDYSVERHVVYVAKRPPRTIFRSIAAHLGRQIVYLPAGQLAPSKLKKLRVVHILDGQERRKTAGEYLW